jgi:hypothetical protein
MGSRFNAELALIPLRANHDPHLKCKRVIECQSDC